MSYNTEVGFSKALTTKLKNAGYNITRIESHSTGNGLPDMFVQGDGIDFWLELKNTVKDTNRVAWRAGQQAWMLEYFRLHKYNKCCLTLQAMNSGILIVPMVVNYVSNTVGHPQVISYDTWYSLDDAALRKLFATMTDTSLENKYVTDIYELLENFVDKHFNGKDYDPDVWNIPEHAKALWFLMHKLEIVQTLLYSK